MSRFLYSFLFLILCTMVVAQDAAVPTLERDTVVEKMSIAHNKFKAVNLIVPGVMITAGAIGTHFKSWNDYKLLDRNLDNDQIKIDDYLEWGMLGWVFVCDLMGKEKNNWVDQLFVIGIAEALNGGIVQGLKHTVKEWRPDGTRYAFPSGHTANAFLGAHVAFKEFRETSPVLAFSGYLIAGFVGVSRVYNNRHWIADVLAGAGIGMVCVELSYLIYFPIRNAIARNVNAKAAKNMVLAPTVNEKGGGLYFSIRF